MITEDHVFIIFLTATPLDGFIFKLKLKCRESKRYSISHDGITQTHSSALTAFTAIELHRFPPPG